MNEKIYHRTSRLTILVIGFILNVNGIGQDRPLSELYLELVPSICTIETYNEKGEALTIGTGFFIESSGIGLSNYHVFVNAKSAIVTTSNYETFPVNNIISYDSFKDIIKFSIDNPLKRSFPSLPISDQEPPIGSKVFTIGNPLGLEKTITDGIVSAIRMHEEYGRLIQVSIPVSQGNSGGPLLNMKGEAIGIVTMGVNNAQNLNFAVCIDDLESLQIINDLVFPEERHHTYTSELFQPYPFGASKIFVQAREKESELDVFMTNMWTKLYSIENNYTEVLVYKNTYLDTLACKTTYLFQRGYLDRIKYEGVSKYLDYPYFVYKSFDNVLIEFVYLYQVLTELYGMPAIPYAKETPWVAEELDSFNNYSDYLVSIFQSHPNEIVLFKWQDYQENIEIKLDIVFSENSSNEYSKGDNKEEPESYFWTISLNPIRR